MALQPYPCQFCSPAVDLTLSLALPSPAPPQAITTLQPCLCQFWSPVDYLTLALRSPAPPQGDVVALAQLWQYWLLGGAGAGHQGAAAASDDGQASLQNGHTGADNNPDQRWPLMIVNAENRLFNGVVPAAMPPAPMEAENEGRVGEKRRRVAPPVAGSQCRRSNGKRWRCKERTQGGSGFCEEHRRQDREHCAATRARRRHAAALAKAKATAAPQAGV